jgi:hypothetical protein
MILITVPHGGADPGGDDGAYIFLGHLERALETSNLEYQTLVGTTSREIVDLNRPEAYGTEYYSDFITALPQTDVHIDLHSFFPYPETTEHGYSLEKWGAGDIVLLDIPNVTEQSLLKKLVDVCTDREVSYLLQPALFENFLTNVASSLFDTPSVLIEINEEAGREFDSIADAVAEAVAGYSVESVEPVASEPVA